MREIKFRAWSGEEMLYDWLVLKSGRHESSQKFTYPQTLSRGAEVAMQYTGLKDKNGKEIYEGDIIQNIRYHPKEKWARYQVEFEGGRFTMRNIENNGTSLGIWNVHNDCEVIGNIYEHSHLLK